MAIAHLLTDFTAPPPEAPPPPDDTAERLAESYEAGFRDGREEARHEQEEEAARRSAEAVRNLQDLSFTYHEAHTQMIRSLRPLFAELTGRVLPSIARDTLVPQLAEQLAAIARDHAPPSVTILAPPGLVADLSTLAAGDHGMNVTIAPDPALEGAQLSLRFAEQEVELDHDRLLAGLSAAVEAFFDAKDKDADHG